MDAPEMSEHGTWRIVGRLMDRDVYIGMHTGTLADAVEKAGTWDAHLPIESVRVLDTHQQQRWTGVRKLS